MKRIISFILALTIIFSLAACTESPNKSKTVNGDEDISTVSGDEDISSVVESSVYPDDIKHAVVYNYVRDDGAYTFQFIRKNGNKVYFHIFDNRYPENADYTVIFTDDAKFTDGGFKMECDEYAAVCTSLSAVVSVKTNEHECAGNYRYSEEEIRHDPLPEFPKFVADANTDGLVIDAVLGKTIREELGRPENAVLTKDMLASVTTLTINDDKPVELTGLEYCINLADFYCNTSYLRDISILSKLPKIKYFAMGWGYVTEIPDISGLEYLETLSITGNLISDISPVAKSKSLKSVYLSDNRIKSIAPLKDVHTLTDLGLNNDCIIDWHTVENNDDIRKALKKAGTDLSQCIEVEKKAKSIVAATVNDGMDDLEKEYKLYRYIIDNIEYGVVHGLAKAYGYDGLIGGTGVCLEYAESFALIACHAGLDVIVCSSDTHSWNMIHLNGCYYHIDTLWDEGDESNVPQFFNISTEIMMDTAEHSHDLLRYPLAVKMPYLEYAYIREGL